MTRAEVPDEFWEDDDEPENQATTAHAFSAGHQEAGALLLELVPALIRLHILLSEAEEDEFRVLQPRLRAFLECADNLPRVATPQRRLGFKHPKIKHRRKRGLAKR